VYLVYLPGVIRCTLFSAFGVFMISNEFGLTSLVGICTSIALFSAFGILHTFGTFDVFSAFAYLMRLIQPGYLQYLVYLV